MLILKWRSLGHRKFGGADRHECVYRRGIMSTCEQDAYLRCGCRERTASAVWSGPHGRRVRRADFLIAFRIAFRSLGGLERGSGVPREPRAPEDVIEPTFFLYENSEKSYSHHVQSPRVNVWRASPARMMHARLRTNIAGSRLSSWQP
jgi:hypothetical protein